MANSTINSIPVKTISRPSSDVLLSEYPDGLSMFETSSADPTYPVMAAVLTVKITSNRGFQITVDSDNNLRFRWGHSGGGWHPWETVTGG